MKHEGNGMEIMDEPVEKNPCSPDEAPADTCSSEGGTDQSYGEPQVTTHGAGGEEAQADDPAPGDVTRPSAGSPAQPAGPPAETTEEAYLRGRNDAIRDMLSRPGLYECPGRRLPRDADDPDTPLAAQFLNRLRPSAWD